MSLVIAVNLVALLGQRVGVNAHTPAGKSSAHAEQRSQKLDIQLSPSVAFAPAVLRSTVFVEQHPDNRLLRVSVDGDNYYSSSDIALEGAESRRSHEVLWRDVPAGVYQVSTVLYGSTGTRATLVRRFTVIGH